ncbi:general transcription factor II-I repeat domain-containing protein 2-like [Tachypleus tridentatus]|uniref:general transcription factor II-I repeat domain-containing protein 2-like n=1 Tax=Tachypleus tridentatus TaxID=6853 RepID=UPI003FD3AF5D
MHVRPNSNPEKELSNSNKHIHKNCKRITDVTLTSYKLSHLLASRMRPYTDGEILKQGILLFTENCCPTSTQKATKLQLSNDTVTRRECISNDLREQLMSESKNFVCYSIALDGTKDIANIEQLAFSFAELSLILPSPKNFFLFALFMVRLGAEIFQQMMTVLKDAELDPAKLVGVATDGAPSMLGLGEGLQGHITRWRQAEELKPVVWHHYYGDVIIFTAVRWLSRSSVIKRFHALLPEIRTFLQEKGEDVPQLNDNQWLQDLAFVDITGHLAHLNLQLQGKDKMSRVVCHFTAFTSKLELWISQLQRGSTLHFPTLAEFSASSFSYTEVLVDLKVEFDHRFKDFKTSIEELHFFFAPFNATRVMHPHNTS